MGITQEKAVLKVEVQGSAQAERLMRSFGLTTEKEMEKAGKSTEGNLARMAASYLSLAKGIQLASKAITSGVNFNNFVQNQTMAFTVMMKSADLAKAKLDELYTFAVNSPLTFKETVGASKSLLAYGFAAEELVPTMKTLGTVAMATGHSLDDISYVYGTLRSQGRAYTRDLMQFGMRGIPIYEELAKVMNVNVKDLKKLTEEGKVGFPQVEQAMKNMTAEGGRFGGMLEESMKTVTGQYSMLVDIAQQSAGALTKGLTEQFIPAMQMLNKALTDNQDNLATIGSAMGSVFAVAIESVAKLIDLFVILKPVIIAIGAYLLATAIPGIIAGIQLTITSIGVLSAALMASPLGPWIIALTAAAVAATWAWNAVNAKIKANADATRAASKELEKYNNQMELMSEKRMGRSGSTKALAPPTDEMNDYMDKLREQYAKYLAERQRDEKYIIDAVVNYGRMKKLEEARKLFGEGSPLFTEAKRYIDAMADYEVKQLKDAQKKAWEESLADYQERYDKVIAQQHVEDMSNIYAVAELEYAATKKDIEEKLKGAGVYRDQALATAKKLHDITMENIKKEADARLNSIVGETTSTRGMVESSAFQAQKTRQKASDTTGAYGIPSSVPQDLYEATIAQIESMKQVVASNLETVAGMQDGDMMIAVHNKYIRAANLELARLQAELAGIVDEFETERKRAEKLAGYEGDFGDPAVFEDVKIAFVDNINKGNIFGAVGDAIALSFEDTIIGKMISSTNKMGTAVKLTTEAFMDLANTTLNTLIGAISDTVVGFDLQKSAASIGQGIGRFINSLFGLTEAVDTTKDTISKIKDEISALDGQFSMLVDAAKSLSQAQVDSLQDLYEVGAISGAEYASEVGGINDTLNDNLQAAYLAAGKEYVEPLAKDATLKSVFEALSLVATELGVKESELAVIEQQAASTTIAPDSTSALSDAAAGGLAGAAVGAGVGSIIPVVGTAIGAAVGGAIGAIGGALGDLFGWWDVGSPNIEADQMGVVHKGEAIIPKTFAEGIRGGELTLSGKGANTASGDTYITVQVSGSVTTENDLASAIAKRIHTQRSRGLLTV